MKSLKVKLNKTLTSPRGFWRSLERALEHAVEKTLSDPFEGSLSVQIWGPSRGVAREFARRLNLMETTPMKSLKTVIHHSPLKTQILMLLYIEHRVSLVESLRSSLRQTLLVPLWRSLAPVGSAIERFGRR